MLPTSLLVLIGVLTVGFVGSFAFAIYSQRKSHVAYNKLNAMDSPSGKSNPSGGGVGAVAPGYHSSARADYAIPQSHNVVTYCVIDDRLVDQ